MELRTFDGRTPGGTYLHNSERIRGLLIEEGHICVGRIADVCMAQSGECPVALDHNSRGEFRQLL